MLYKKIISHIITKYQLISQLRKLVNVSNQPVLVEVVVADDPLLKSSRHVDGYISGSVSVYILQTA